jgi:phage terminase large subunit-like protein
MVNVRDYAAIAEGYISRVMSGEELVCRKVRATVERHVRDLESSNAPRAVGAADNDYPFFWDAEPGIRFCRLFENVNPSKWPTKMVMAPWMVACTLILYGWKHKKPVDSANEQGDPIQIYPRRFRRAFLMWPRKMGKSAYLSVGGINALVADGEKGAEVYSAGIVEKQARRVFDEAVAMVDSTPALRAAIKKSGSMPCRSLHNPKAPNSEFRPLSRDKDAIQGTNPSFAACDEVHVWNGRGVYPDIRWGMRARLQPLLVAITTAPPEDATNEQIAVELYEFSVKVLDGVIEDDSFFCWITELDGELKNAAGEVLEPADEWDDETKWIKACPNLGVTVRIEDMRQEALEARNSASSLKDFKQYSLNLRVAALNQAIPTADWDKCARPGDAIALRKETLAALSGRICFAGLDLADTGDTNALSLFFPPMTECFHCKTSRPEFMGDGWYHANGAAIQAKCTREKWRVVPFFWIPGDSIKTRVENHRVPYDVWASQGFLTLTPGKAVDKDFIAGKILELSKLFDLRELAYDPALASGLIKTLLEKGFKKDRVVKFAQTMLNYAAPCVDFVTAIAREELQHDADPVLRWQITNLRWLRNYSGLYAPDKLKSVEKIDGAVASIMAYGRATHPDNAKLLKPKAKVSVL